VEPQERIDPYAQWTKQGDALKTVLMELPTIREPAALADRIRRLYNEGVHGKPLPDVRLYLLHEALPLAPRVGEGFTAELIALVPEALGAGTGGPNEPSDLRRKQGELLERALFLAGHLGRRDLVQMLVGRFVELVRTMPEASRFRLINMVAGDCLRSLRKFGLRDDIDRLLAALQSEVLQGATLTELRGRHAAKPEAWGQVLQTLLNLACGWLTFERHDHAAPILNEARDQLLGQTGLKTSAEYTALARAYVAALGHGPQEFGLLRMKELFRGMDRTRITNSHTTAPYYSRFHLSLVEETVFAVCRMLLEPPLR
jgi:hypothetical protein